MLLDKHGGQDDQHGPDDEQHAEQRLAKARIAGFQHSHHNRSRVENMNAGPHVRGRIHHPQAGNQPREHIVSWHLDHPQGLAVRQESGNEQERRHSQHQGVRQRIIRIQIRQVAGHNAPCDKYEPGQVRDNKSFNKRNLPVDRKYNGQIIAPGYRFNYVKTDQVEDQKKNERPCVIRFFSCRQAHDRIQ